MNCPAECWQQLQLDCASHTVKESLERPQYATLRYAMEPQAYFEA